MNFTQKQQNAIDIRNKDVLISAAAGSGKTTVLAKRVLSLILDGADIDRMLICTYTRLAASELRQRIYESLMSAADERRDARLRAQAEHVAEAYIGTIHSFCTQVISDNFLKANLKLGWRTATSALAQRLMKEASEEALESLYEEENQELLWLSERYGGRNDKRLVEFALDLYYLSRSMPEGLEWLKKNEEDFSQLIQMSAQHYVTSRLRLAFDMSDKCFAIVNSYEDFERQRAYTQKMADNLKGLERAFQTGGITALLDAINALSRMVSARNLVPEEAKRAYARYNDIIKKSCIQKLKEFCEIASNNSSLMNEARYMEKLNSALYAFLKRFEGIYARLKGELGVLDYDDLIHTAYGLLMEDEIAEIYRDKIDYVFVDEFQDTNSVQDALIERICEDGKRFIVGDVKQSIYSFRLADPRVFLKKAKEIGVAGEVIFMNDNFRSSWEIISDVNELMGSLMKDTLGGIDYSDEERLKPNREKAGHRTRFLCAISGEEDAYCCEANAIADEIEKLTSEGYRFGDVAILLRSKAGADKFKQTLEARGIPAYFDGALSSPPEIDLFVQYLKLIDSENEDIALIAAMRAPAGGFTEEDFAKIRAYCPEESFSHAVKNYCGEDAQLKERIEVFLSDMDRLRLFAYAMPVEEFLIELKKYSRFENILPALPGGEVRADSFSRFFDKLLEYAKEGGIYELLCTLEQVREKNNGSYAESSESALPDNCVKIMTIHASKGLQFKVVFVSCLNKKFNLKDAQDAIISNTSWGAVSRIYDTQTMRKYPSLSYTLVGEDIKAASRSEELRVLYVALTRAEERLYLTCSKKQEEELKFIPAEEASTFYDWICPIFYDRIEFIYPKEEKQEEKKGKGIGIKKLLDEAKKENPPEVILANFERIPVKMGVSSLLSPYENEETSSPLNAVYEQEEGETAGQGLISAGAEFGTMIHAFLQHYDYRNMPSVESQLKELKQKKLFSEEECKSVLGFRKELEAFLKSDVAKRIGAADEVLRELPFSIGVCGRELGYHSDDIVVIQGIIDVVLREKDGYTIIDYKTNRSKNYAKLKEHYGKQMDFYKRALLECIGITDVHECLLCFIRTGVTISL